MYQTNNARLRDTADIASANNTNGTHYKHSRKAPVQLVAFLGDLLIQSWIDLSPHGKSEINRRQRQRE